MALLIILGILAVIYGIVSFFEITPNEGNPFHLPLGKVVLIIGIVLIVVVSMIVKIDAQQVGVKVTPTGVTDEPLKTGWHVVMPWNDIHKMDKTVWVFTCAKKNGHTEEIWAPTKDGIKLGFDVSVSWHIDENKAPWLYQNVCGQEGHDDEDPYRWMEDNVIKPKLKSAMALTVSKYTPIAAYSTGRQVIQDEVLTRIVRECKAFNLIVSQVDIREVYYYGEYEKAINAKKLAEQRVLTLQEITKQKQEELKQAEINKNIAIQKAEGEAKALQIKGSSINQNPRIIELEWINKWDGALPTYMMGSGQGVMINLKN